MHAYQIKTCKIYIIIFIETKIYIVIINNNSKYIANNIKIYIYILKIKCNFIKISKTYILIYTFSDVLKCFSYELNSK